jgi:uncharacterized membrane protein
MNLLMLILRIVHVGAAVIWGGGALLMGLFIGRGVEATAEAGQQFARYLINTMRVHIFMTVAAVATVLGGIGLYWLDSKGFSSAWMRSGAGIGFGIGAGFGLIAFVSGIIFGNGNAQLGKIGAQIQGKPSAEQLAQLQEVQKRMRRVSPYHVISMILAIAFMATARYFTF